MGIRKNVHRADGNRVPFTLWIFGRRRSTPAIKAIEDAELKRLPPDFRWYRWLVSGQDFGDMVLRLGGEVGMEIAMVRLRVDGATWLSEVRRYGYPSPHVVTRSRDRAIEWASRWAAANESTIRKAARDREARHGLKPYSSNAVDDDS